jgi:hypothetical protein
MIWNLSKPKSTACQNLQENTELKTLSMTIPTHSFQKLQ